MNKEEFQVLKDLSEGKIGVDHAEALLDKLTSPKQVTDEEIRAEITNHLVERGESLARTSHPIYGEDYLLGMHMAKWMREQTGGGE